jgi:DNA-directed RNA polymerase specialized sigma24 family protein
VRSASRPRCSGRGASGAGTRPRWRGCSGSPAALERIHAGQLLEHALSYLPDDQARAVQARIVDEHEYEDIARELRTSEAVVRQRVSRGLSALRRQVEDNA